MSDWTCVCGRTFLKQFGLHVHQRTCAWWIAHQAGAQTEKPEESANG